MNAATIEKELIALSPEQQDRISAFLVFLRLKRDGLLEEVSSRLNDGNSENWVLWEELESEEDTGNPG
ncbi:hypothetical protein ACFQY0_10600 [Haloferula chungangensis]|uniref:DUF2281 domain-containing protein n=1 Tax=Haloferula chungangensis TaxID=1048331 RepID=A0ABW2L5N8_9BACT